MCVCIRILSAACVSRRHTPRSPGTRQFPDRSPKFGIVDRRSSIDLKVPMWNRQNHIFLLRHKPCHSSNIFPNWKFSHHERVQPFSVFQSFRSRSFQSQPSTSTNQRTLLVRRSRLACGVEQTGVEEFSTASFCLMILNEPCPSFSFNSSFFFFRATSPEPPIADKGWEGGVDSTGGRNQLLNRLPQVLIERYEKKPCMPAYGGSPFCDRVFRETRNQGAGYLREEWNSWKWTTSKQRTPKFSRAPLIRVEIETGTTQTLSSSKEHMEVNGGLTLLSTLVSCRRKRGHDCMWLPTTLNMLKRQLPWRKAGRMSKQSRGNHRSMSFELLRQLRFGRMLCLCVF